MSETGGVRDLMVLETWMGCSGGLLELDNDWRGTEEDGFRGTLTSWTKIRMEF